MADSVFFVNAHANDFNNNNLKESSPYTVVTQEQERLVIQFDEDQLPYIEDFLIEEKIAIHKTPDCSAVRYIVCPHGTTPGDFLERLHWVQTSFYNVEVWESCLSCGLLPNEDNPEVMYEPVSASLLIPLRNDDLRLIQRIFSCKHFGAKIDGTDVREMEKLKERIQQKMVPQKPYFARLSSRSPKDVLPVDHQENELKDPLARLSKRNSVLKVTCAEQVLYLLLNSQRIAFDIAAFFKFRGQFSCLNLYLREWIDNLPHDKEFRCYVYKKQLTAISQYHCYDIFPALQDEAIVLCIRKSIIHFHKCTKDALIYPSYVIDVIVNEGTVRVVECNPFGAEQSSGSGLFNWAKDFDILYGKRKDIEYPQIRILRKLL